MKFQAMNNLIELFLQNYHTDNILQQNLKVYENFFYLYIVIVTM